MDRTQSAQAIKKLRNESKEYKQCVYSLNSAANLHEGLKRLRQIRSLIATYKINADRKKGL